MSDLLQSLVYDDFGYRKEGRNWGRAEQHTSLIVNEEAQKWYWNSQDVGGGVLDYLLLVRGMEKSKARELIDSRGMLMPEIPSSRRRDDGKPYDKLVELLWTLGKGNREYWYDRKLTDKTIDRYQLGFYNGWYLLPLYNGDSFINFQCRRDEPKRAIKYWYKQERVEPVLVNPDLLGLVDTVWITEGTIDSLLLNQEGEPSISQTGGSGFWNDAWFPLFHRVKSVVYIADNDDAGRHAAERVAASLGVDRTRVYLFENKEDKYDTVDYFRDGGTITQLRELVEEKSKYVYEIGELNKGNLSTKKRWSRR